MPGSVRARDSTTALGLWLPFAIAAVWWAICFTLYVVAWPIAYTHRNMLGVSALMTATLACAIAGYHLGIGDKRLAPVPASWKIPVTVLIGLVASLALAVPLGQTYSGFGPFDLGNALTDQSTAFSQASQRISEGFSARSGIVVLQTALAPFTLGVIPFLALSWFEARKHGVMLLLAIAAPLYLDLLVGRSAQIGISGILVVGAWVLSRIRRRMKLRRLDAMVLILIGLALVAAFAAQRFARFAGAPICPPGSDICTGANPSFIEAAWITFASYASQGLEGLGRSLAAVWTFGGGFSHSPAIESMLARTFDFQPAPVVTSQQTGLGWSDTSYWSTALASIANDVPWLLVPLVIGAQAVILGSVWRSAVEGADWLSVTIFCYTWLGLLFVPQNLQLAISGPTYVGYIALLVLYLARKLTLRPWVGSQRAVARST